MCVCVSDYHYHYINRVYTLHVWYILPRVTPTNRWFSFRWRGYE